MPLGSIEFKELLNDFGEDVRDINSELYQASKPSATAKKRQAIMKTARKKLKAYDDMLGRLDGAQRQAAEKDFAELMAHMRNSLTKLEKVT